MKLNPVVLSAVLLALPALPVPASADPIETEHKSIERQDETSLLAVVEFGAGSLDLHPGDDKNLLDATITYDREYIDVYVDYSRRRDQGYLELASDLEHRGRIHKLTNEWEIGLGVGIPTELELEVGAAEARLDFSGLSLERLEVEIGAADAEIEWSMPNPEVLTELDIECGASSLDLKGLGYANFEYLAFDGGMGSFDLDFSGDWQRSASADFDIGMGSLELSIPAHIGVQIETDGSFLSSFDVDRHYRKIDQDLYRSENYEDAEIQLDIRVQLGMGSVDIRRIGR